MLHTRFYDQILSTIEIGQVRDGINQLAGMLDGLTGDAVAFAAAGAALHRHPLHQLLRQDPLATAKGQYPNFGGESGNISSTGRRVFEATSALPFIKALQERQHEAARQLELAWQSQRAVCLIDGRAVLELVDTEDHDLSLTHFIMSNPRDADWVFEKFGVSAFFPGDASADQPQAIPQVFDLISATQVADHLPKQQLTALISRLAAKLSVQGALSLSAIQPDHLGSGWRKACHQQHLICHSEADLAAMAVDIGLNSHIYHDATGCLVWCELRAPHDA